MSGVPDPNPSSSGLDTSGGPDHRLNSCTGRPVRRSTGRTDLKELGYVNPDDVIEGSEESETEQGQTNPAGLSLADIRRQEAEDDREIDEGIAAFEAHHLSLKRSFPDDDGPWTDRPAIRSKRAKRAKQASRESSQAPTLREFDWKPPFIPEKPVVTTDPSELYQAFPPVEIHIRAPSGGIRAPSGSIMKLFLDARAAKPKCGQVIVVDSAKFLRTQTGPVICPPEMKLQGRYTNVPEESRAVGFLDLPPELRNTVYRLLFVTTNKVDFNLRDNLCRSSALLSTCKQVHKEGRSVLYGENQFSFTRIRTGRGRYFERIWEEVAYEDMYRFFRDIGKDNLKYIPAMEIYMLDGVLVDNREKEREECRFVHDVYLRHSLKLIARYGVGLKVLKIGMHGAKRVSPKTDAKFLNTLQRIRGLESLEFFTLWGRIKMHNDEMTSCLNTMVLPEHRAKHATPSDLTGTVDLLGRSITQVHPQLRPL